MEKDQPILERIFKNWGFCIEKIPGKPNIEQADYRIRDTLDTYFIEVKQKFDDKLILQEYLNKLETDDVFYRAEPEGYNNAFSNVFDKAASQLKSTTKSDDEFQLIWFEVSGIDRNLQFQQALSTIYGIVSLIPCTSGRPTAKDCFYFKHNVAYRQPKIDAFFLTDGESLTLALNAFSIRRQAFLASKLYQLFAERDAISDPIAMEQSGNIYVADCSIPRSDTKAVLEYVQNKYRMKKFLLIEMISHTASVTVQPNNDYPIH